MLFAKLHTRLIGFGSNYDTLTQNILLTFFASTYHRVREVDQQLVELEIALLKGLTGMSSV
jgi:hypothetical protein